MGKTYTIAIRVYDDLAPNLYDTYVWDDAVKVSGALAVVNDNGTANANAIKSDLDALGAGYTSLNSSDVHSASDLESYLVVIWCPGDSYGQVSTTERSIMRSYVDNGGNLFLPYHYMYSVSDSATMSRFGNQSYWGTGWSGVPYGYWQTGSGSIAWDGPAGNIQRIYTSYLDFTTLCYSWNRTGNPKRLWYWLGTLDSYWSGGGRDNGTAGDHQGWAIWSGSQWDKHTGTYPSTPGRKGALWNIIEYMDPTLI